MSHQTSSMLVRHTGQGKRWWRTLLNHGLVVLRLLPRVRLPKALMLPLIDFVAPTSSKSAPSPAVSVDDEAVPFDNETEDSFTSTGEEAVTYNWDDYIHKKLTKGKLQIISDGSTTTSSEDEDSTDDDDCELKRAMIESITYDRGLELWIRFRTPGATFHKGETSGISASSSDSPEFQN
ncbi:hypothetical protein QQ045_002119 [Rhodiola kirilowii]